MACPAQLTLPAHVRGDTWEGFAVTGILIDDAAPATALASVLIHFRSATDATGTADHVLSTADADELVIDDADAWAFTAPAQDLPLAAGKWYYDIQCTDAAGDIRTYIAGTLTIIQDVTRT